MKLILVWLSLCLCVGLGQLDTIQNAEDTPRESPSDVTCITLTSQAIRVSWAALPDSEHTCIKVIYGPSELWYDNNYKNSKEIVDVIVIHGSDIVIRGLNKYANYTIQVMAKASGRDGIRSQPIHCQTEQDVPEAPNKVKAVVKSKDSILVSWRQPAQSNGIILHYTVYYKPTIDPVALKAQRVNYSQMEYEVSKLETNTDFEFWISASTIIGESLPSNSVHLTINDENRVPAQISTFDETFNILFKTDVNLPCIAVGSPTPNVSWRIRGEDFTPNDHIIQLSDGTLSIKGVSQQDAGEYVCTAENTIANDTITHKLIVNATPKPPTLTQYGATTDSLKINLNPHDSDVGSLIGYKVHYKQQFDDWEINDVAAAVETYSIENLYCGTCYEVYAIGYNRFGAGEASDILNICTKGSIPLLPDQSIAFIASSNPVLINLDAWKDGGCSLIYFVIEIKPKNQVEWTPISNNVKPSGRFGIYDLEPATWYDFRIIAHNSAGFSVYELPTMTVPNIKWLDMVKY